MELYVLNSGYETIGIVDNYKSFIWTKRYSDFGDCEIYVEANEQTFGLFQTGNFLIRNDDDMICRIDSVELQADVEEGNYLIVTGSDCRSILSQRIVWEQTNFNGTVENYIRKLINDAIINPTIASRKISNFKLGAVKGFTETITQQVTYDQLDEKIIEICKTYGYGSKVTFDNNVFTFDLYKGVDRSYAQNVNDFVVFSPDFDNLKTSTYLSDVKNLKNVALIGGEGEGIDRERAIYGTATGIDRREMFVDAQSVSTLTEEGDEIDYDEALLNQGVEALAERVVVTAFEGEVEPNYTYKYGTDYNIGDIVQIRNEYGIEASVRVIEVIESFDENGYSLIPAFEYVEV